MSVHVAIVTPRYERLILDGTKTAECRLTRTAQPPFGCIAPGERVYLKRSGGPFFAVAQVARVWMADRLTHRDIAAIRRRFDDVVHGDPSYWNQRRDCRYATIVWLREVRRCSLRPRYTTRNMRAWYTLDDAADPMNGRSPSRSAAFEVRLTAGAIRQKSVRISDAPDRFPPESMGGRTKAEAGEPFELRLSGGPTVWTDVVAATKLIRWRGWGAWFESAGVRAGDRLRFTPCGPRAFAVRPVRISQ